MARVGPHALSAPARLAALLLVAGLAGACDASNPRPTAPSPSAGSSPSPTATVGPSPTPTPTPSAMSSPATAGPAASPLPPGVVPCPGSAARGHPTGTNASARSSNWSGYVATSRAQQFSCVEGTWKQPSVHCPSRGVRTVSYWVGIGGVGQEALEQIGTQTECAGGRAIVVAWHESLPRERAEVTEPLDVRPGDTVWAQARWLGAAAYRLSLVDITHPVQFGIRDSNPTLRRTSAEWIVEAPTGGCPDSCHVLSMPDFGRLRFSGTWVTAADVRAPLDGSGFTHERETMITRKGLVRSVVSSTAPDGTSFTVVWKRP